jgi:hypothetical protein
MRDCGRRCEGAGGLRHTQPTGGGLVGGALVLGGGLVGWRCEGSGGLRHTQPTGGVGPWGGLVRWTLRGVGRASAHPTYGGRLGGGGRWSLGGAWWGGVARGRAGFATPNLRGGVGPWGGLVGGRCAGSGGLRHTQPTGAVGPWGGRWSIGGLGGVALRGVGRASPHPTYGGVTAE